VKDLGAGVFEVPDEPVVNGRVGPGRPRDLTCPWCGLHDRSGPIDHPDFNFFCGCGSMFNGTDAEWWELKTHREQAARRREANTRDEEGE